MMTATLGGLIKDYRLKKRLSQQDVSLKIGWKDTTRLSKIEQGRVGKPNRETIDRLIHALDLTENETGNFLLVGGYLPTEEEIKKGIAVVKEKIDNWPYPAYFQDFSFRFLYCNANYPKSMNLPSSYKNMMQKERPHLLETAFDPKYYNGVEEKFGYNEKSILPFPIAMTAVVKNDIESYQNESWYKKLIKKMMNYDDFRNLWPQLNETTLNRTLQEYDYDELTGIFNGKNQTLKFHIFAARFVKDPRFWVLFYTPVDKSTEEFFTASRR